MVDCEGSPAFEATWLLNYSLGFALILPQRCFTQERRPSLSVWVYLNDII